MDVIQKVDPREAEAARNYVSEMPSLFKVFEKERLLKSDKAETMKDFNNAAMFQVNDVTLNTNNDEAASSYMMSIKIWDTDVIKEQWFYEAFTNQNPNGGPIITLKP